MSLNNKSSGFTLVEVAIVLVVVGLLLAGGINLMSVSSDTASYKESKNNLNDIKEAILGLYVNKNFLPCPDTNTPPDGFGNYLTPAGAGAGTTASDDAFKTGTGGVCASPMGWLPFNDLGIGGNGDSWGEPIKYVTSRTFSVKATSSFCSSNIRPNANNQITIQDLQTTPVTVGDWAGFALISTGKNGRQTNAGMTGAFTGDGGCAPGASPPLDARERANCTASNAPMILRYGNQMINGTTVIFDDIVVWVGDMQLISELRKSGLCSS
jgi:prepilin-type N-terminal cleavage/methylation domain-containing protein